MPRASRLPLKVTRQSRQRRCPQARRWPGAWCAQAKALMSDVGCPRHCGARQRDASRTRPALLTQVRYSMVLYASKGAAGLNVGTSGAAASSWDGAWPSGATALSAEEPGISIRVVGARKYQAEGVRVPSRGACKYRAWGRVGRAKKAERGRARRWRFCTPACRE